MLYFTKQLAKNFSGVGMQSCRRGADVAIATTAGPSYHGSHTLGKGVETRAVSSSARGPASRFAEARGEL